MAEEGRRRAGEGALAGLFLELHGEARAVWDAGVVPRLGRTGLAALALCGRAGRAERERRRAAGERVTPLPMREVFGDVRLLAWAVGALGLTVNSRTAHRAANAGYLEAVQWLCGEGRLENELLESSLCECAASGGQVEVMGWLRKQGAPWGDTCQCAAIFGHLDALKWAREMGAPWDERVCWYATREGHLETLRWLVANDCPFNRDRCLRWAKEENQSVMVEWLEQLDL